MATFNEETILNVKAKLKKHFEQNLSKDQVDQLRDFLSNNLPEYDAKFFKPETEITDTKIDFLAGLIQDQIQQDRQNVCDWKWSHKF